MEKIVCGALIIAILLQITIAQTEHIVGDSFGWSIPINGAAAYAMWADANSIKIGDTLGILSVLINLIVFIFYGLNKR